MFRGYFLYVSRVLPGCFQGISWIFRGCFQDVFWVFPECAELHCAESIYISSQYPFIKVKKHSIGLKDFSSTNSQIFQDKMMHQGNEQDLVKSMRGVCVWKSFFIYFSRMFVGWKKCVGKDLADVELSILVIRSQIVDFFRSSSLSVFVDGKISPTFPPSKPSRKTAFV